MAFMKLSSYLFKASIAACKFAFAIPLLCATNECVGQDAADLRERFLTSAPQAWEDYRKFAVDLQGSGHWKWVLTDKGTLTAHSKVDRTYDFKHREGCALLFEREVIEDGKPSQGAFLRVVNPQYGFELRRSSPDAPWVVANYAPGLTFGGKLGPMNWVDEVAAYPVSFAATAGLVDYPSRDQGFKLLNVTAATQDGKNLAKVEFEFHPADKLKQYLRGGWVLYDPDAHWVQRACHLRLERPQGSPDKMVKATQDLIFEYIERGGGFPILKRIVATYDTVGGKYSSEERIELSLNQVKAPKSAFTLSAFGFPEPMGAPVTHSGISWYMWFAAMGFACLVAAFLLRRGLPWRKKGAPAPG
jgi:hypothetical protein